MHAQEGTDKRTTDVVAMYINEGEKRTRASGFVLLHSQTSVGEGLHGMSYGYVHLRDQVGRSFSKVRV